jgi:O-antigen/teichoic acid export membrane protein
LRAPDRERFLRAFVARGIASTLVRSAFGTLTLQAAYVALSFSTVVLLARLLGVSGYGAYAFSIAWAGLFGVPAVLGFDRLIVRDVATYAANERWGSVRGLLRLSNRLVLLVATCLALCAGVAGLSVLQNPVRATFTIGMILVPLTAMTLLRQASLQGLGRPVQSQFPELFVKPIILTVILGAIWLLIGTGLAPMTAMSLNVVVTGLAFGVGAILLHRSVPRQGSSRSRAEEQTSS